MVCLQFVSYPLCSVDLWSGACSGRRNAAYPTKTGKQRAPCNEL